MDFGRFNFDRTDESVRDVLSGQTVRRRHSHSQGDAFEYRDEEVTLSFAVEQRELECLVDFRQPEMERLIQCYGLWRRLAFFLPDCLTVWLNGTRESWSQSRVTLVGGRQNGNWNSSLLLRTDVSSPPSTAHPESPENGVIKLSPLCQEPTAWRFRNVRSTIKRLLGGPQVAPEVTLATVGGDIPFLHGKIPIDKQLANAPRFVRADGKATIFHRFVQTNFHRGENYDPIPHYGYANEQVAFTFYAQSLARVCGYNEPILVSRETVPSDSFESHVRVGDQSLLRLHLGLREELFFALIDINALTHDLDVAKDLPVIREKDSDELHYFSKRLGEDPRRWPGLKFGRHLDGMSGTPMRTPLGSANTSFTRPYGRGLGR